MSKQEECKDNEYYKYALEHSRIDLPNLIGILDEKSKYKDPQGIGDKIIIRQNNVLIYLNILILQKLDKISQQTLSKLERDIDTLKSTKPLSNLFFPPSSPHET